MAELPRTGPMPLFLGLPEEIFSLEILVRLPSKDLVRCRAVCRAWHRVTSTYELLLAHHQRQPSLALVLLTKHEYTSGGNLHAFDHRTTFAGEARLHPVARLDDSTVITVESSCDGLLLLWVCTFLPYVRGSFFICNPTTRQIGRVPEKIRGFQATALYRHPPTGGYRLLLHMRSKRVYGVEDPCYVFPLGCRRGGASRSMEPGQNLAAAKSIKCCPDKQQLDFLASIFFQWRIAGRARATARGRREVAPPLGCDEQQPKCIGHPPELAGFFEGPVMVRGNLHWSWWPDPLKDQSRKKITVFNTTVESFRLIRSPVVQTDIAHLYEVDDTLGMYISNDGMTTIDIWVMHDYDSEVWSHKYHVQLPVPLASIRAHESRNVMVAHEDMDVFVLYNYGQTLVLCDTERKLLATSHLDGYIVLSASQRIKESLVQHSFFSALQGALDDWSFISWLERGV